MDFHARQYDPQIGRFLGIDPLADAYGQQIFSTYSAMGNAPTHMIDPNGESFLDNNTLRGAGREAGSSISDMEADQINQALMQGRLAHVLDGFSISGGPGGGSGFGYLATYQSTLNFENGGYTGVEAIARAFLANFSAVQNVQENYNTRAMMILTVLSNSYSHASLGGEDQSKDGGQQEKNEDVYFRTGIPTTMGTQVGLTCVLYALSYVSANIDGSPTSANALIKYAVSEIPGLGFKLFSNKEGEGGLSESETGLVVNNFF